MESLMLLSVALFLPFGANADNQKREVDRSPSRAERRRRVPRARAARAAATLAWMTLLLTFLGGTLFGS